MEEKKPSPLLNNLVADLNKQMAVIVSAQDNIRRLGSLVKTQMATEGVSKIDTEVDGVTLKLRLHEPQLEMDAYRKSEHGGRPDEVTKGSLH